MKYPILAAGVLLAGLLATAGCEPKPGDAPQTNWWNAPSEADLLKMANDPTDPDKRRQGINGLSKLSWGGAGRHAGLFVERLGDEDNNVRSAAIRALAQLGQTQYLPALVAKLDDPSLMVRDDAAVALDALHGDLAVAPLQAHASSDPNPQVRGRCARALRHYSSKEVLNTLVACLKDDNFGVRYEAHEALKEITKRDFEYDVARWNSYVSGGNVLPAGAKADRPFQGLLGSGEANPTPPPAPPTPQTPPTDPTATSVLPPPPALDYPIAPARPAAPPAPAASGATSYQRPAWDLLGVTVPKPGAAPVTPAAGGAAGTTVAPGEKPYQRPAWDWLGVTVPKSSDPQPAPAAAGAPGEKPYQRPAWDWLGVTVPKSAPPTPAAPAVQPATPNP